MADVDFGHIINQDESIIPDVYAVGDNIELVTLDGVAIKIKTARDGTTHIISEGGTPQTREIAAGVLLVDTTGTFTVTQLKAAVASLADSASDAASDQASTPTATALVPGTWTPT